MILSFDNLPIWFPQEHYDSQSSLIYYDQINKHNINLKLKICRALPRKEPFQKFSKAIGRAQAHEGVWK